MISIRRKTAICSAMCAMLLLPTCANAVSQKQWVYQNNSWKYVDNNNKALTGWQQINGSWYYLDAANNGVMKTGWQQINGQWYYLGAYNDGAMKSGWQLINGKWYYLGQANDGAMKSEWKQINGKWYYLGSEEDGSMKSGWQQVYGEWYYLGGANDGSMKSDWQQINSKWYYFGQANDGAMKASQWINEYYVGQDGAWIKDYSEDAEVIKVVIKKYFGGSQHNNKEIVSSEYRNIEIITKYVEGLSTIDGDSYESVCGGSGYTVIIEYKDGNTRLCFFTESNTPDKDGYFMISNEKYYKYSMEGIDKVWDEISNPRP